MERRREAANGAAESNPTIHVAPFLFGLTPAHNARIGPETEILGIQSDRATGTATSAKAADTTSVCNGQGACDGKLQRLEIPRHSMRWKVVHQKHVHQQSLKGHSVLIAVAAVDWRNARLGLRRTADPRLLCSPPRTSPAGRYGIPLQRRHHDGARIPRGGVTEGTTPGAVSRFPSKRRFPLAILPHRQWALRHRNSARVHPGPVTHAVDTPVGPAERQEQFPGLADQAAAARVYALAYRPR